MKKESKWEDKGAHTLHATGEISEHTSKILKKGQSLCHLETPFSEGISETLAQKEWTKIGQIVNKHIKIY